MTTDSEGEKRDFNWYNNPPKYKILLVSFFLTIFFLSRGLEQTNTQESRKCLQDDCVKMISSNSVNARDKEIPIDCDALSFVVVADAIDEKLIKPKNRQLQNSFITLALNGQLYPPLQLQ
jgi:hypothetical protein